MHSQAYASYIKANPSPSGVLAFIISVSYLFFSLSKACCRSLSSMVSRCTSSRRSLDSPCVKLKVVGIDGYYHSPQAPMHTQWSVNLRYEPLRRVDGLDAARRPSLQQTRCPLADRPATQSHMLCTPESIPCLHELHLDRDLLPPFRHVQLQGALPVLQAHHFISLAAKTEADAD